MREACGRNGLDAAGHAETADVGKREPELLRRHDDAPGHLAAEARFVRGDRDRKPVERVQVGDQVRIGSERERLERARSPREAARRRA